MTQTLPKSERLSGKTAVDGLLKKGRWGFCGCLRYCFLVPGGSDTSRLMVSVPKKLFKRAVRRNLLKRRLRESYRTQKEMLEGSRSADLMLVYNSKEILDFQEIKKDVAEVLDILSKELSDGR